MKTILILFCLFILNSQFSILNSTIWEIKQDGTGDFTTITEGIDASQSGDTLLVYPGVYYENINFSGKDIVVTSLYRITSDDRRYIRETIIDGNQNGTVVTIESAETRAAVLSGLTIRNGKDFEAGGIHVGGRVPDSFTSPTIKYCTIEHNNGVYGVGGLAFRRYVGNPMLIGNTIRYNNGIIGGLRVQYALDIEFCNEEPNSIYLNYGSYICDISISNGFDRQNRVIIDTLTVDNVRDSYFVRIRYDSPNMPPGFELVVNESKIDPIDSDLYVSPDGCDSNSGLTPEEPLQRIATALLKIQPDRYRRRTVHLAKGVYSRSLNDQYFPIGPREHIDIIGADKETVILDGENEYILINSFGRENYLIKNMTLTRADRGVSPFGPIAITDDKNFTLENIIVTNNIMDTDARGRLTMSFQTCDNFTLRNFDVHNNRIKSPLGQQPTGFTLFSSHVMQPGTTMHAENLRFRSNYGTHAAQIRVRGLIVGPTPYHATFANLEITDHIEGTEVRSGIGRHLELDGKIRVINATISGNRSINTINPTAVNLTNYINYTGNEIAFYNSILYDNGGDYQMVFSRTYDHPGEKDILYVSHSLIEGGIDAITGHSGIVDWGMGNIDEDPLFAGKYNEFGDKNCYPYMLSEDSPARGAGTLDIPGFEFPEYDLAGNPRIVDGKIDMGAYQYYKPTTSIEDEEREGVTERLRDGEFNLRNFPNPVTYLHSDRQAGQTRSSTGTTISFEAPESGEVVIEIYNVKGQFVRRVFDAYITKGEYNVFWDGKDERGRYVATGFYMYNLHFNDELVATGRATFIK